jgi:hypothetical protein
MRSGDSTFLGADVAVLIPAAAVPAIAAVLRNVRRSCDFMGIPWRVFGTQGVKSQELRHKQAYESCLNRRNSSGNQGIWAGSFPKSGKRINAFPQVGMPTLLVRAIPQNAVA